VFNKIDKLDGTAEGGTGTAAQPRIDRPGEGYPRVWLSAQSGAGLDLLRTLLGESLELRHVRGELRVPPQAARLRARLHELGAVCSEVGDEHGWLLQVDLAEADAQRLYVLPHGESLRPLLDVIEQQASQAQAQRDQVLLETRHTPI
jgi:GTP-binding protein HflX